MAFRKFQREDYAEYAAWYADAELNRQLGPMDDEWLEAMLQEPETAGATWAVFRREELVAVVGISLAAQQALPVGINATAVKSALRKQGLGSVVLQKLLALYQAKGLFAFVAYISVDNAAAQQFVSRNGFVQIGEAPDEYGFWEFRYHAPGQLA